MYPTVILFIWTFFVLHSATSHAQLVPKHTKNNTARHHAVCQQDLSKSPPLPILDIGLQYMLGQMGANATKAQNDSIAAENHQPPPPDFTRFTAPNQKDAPAQCGSGQPCADGSCCNSEGKCGFKPYNCKSSAATTCISNCDAHSMCGVDSLNGTQKCGMNICCSYFGYCGTTDAHCTNVGTMPCQQGFGDCGNVTQPSCSNGNVTASKGRKVAYYQGDNVGRPCGRVYPSQIDTTGLTHVVFAQMLIDPVTFSVTPSEPEDILLYHEFTSLKSTRMQTWFSIGGYGFSDPGPTRTTWSDLCAKAENRAAFISSLIVFMNKWGFQGVDLDWEYPGQPDRGGTAADTPNLLSLIREMRAAFGDKFGISLALPNVYTYLAAFGPKDLEPYVTFFNFMAYDLHGPWEEARLGAKLRPQASLLDIESTILPVWFDDMDPAKINLGLPYYGRGNTVSNTSCMDLDCPYSGLSRAGPCTTSPGVLSLAEIQNIITQRYLVPKVIPGILQKQITWDDQWMSYDDHDTFAAKTKYADEHCMGGTMIWSIDLANGNGRPPPPATNISADGSCGKGTTNSCFGSAFGDCCSHHGWCGSKIEYCSAKQGCQDGFGVCLDDNTAFTMPPLPSATPVAPVVSVDATCGNGKTCKGSTFGNCCSKNGWCGSIDAYCSPDQGCQTAFGLCGNNLKVTTDGSCGVGKVCQGSPWGNCCSSNGWCGSTDAYCGNGCQNAFGSCT